MPVSTRSAFSRKEIAVVSPESVVSSESVALDKTYFPGRQTNSNSGANRFVAINKSSHKRKKNYVNETTSSLTNLSEREFCRSRPLPDFSSFAFSENLTKLNGNSIKIEGEKWDKTDYPDMIFGSQRKKKHNPDSKIKSRYLTDVSVLLTPQKIVNSTRSTNSSSRRKTPKIEPGSLTPPKNWKHIFSLVEELRSDRSAPVDSDGAASLAQIDRGETIYRYQILISLMLSSQTKDATVGDAMRTLIKHGLDIKKIQNTPSEKINEMIYKVSFRNNKTKFIKETTDILAKKHNGDIPSTAKELMTLPGVGPKMAYIVESIVFKKATGIGVDTHMHRLFNALGWASSDTPDKTRKQMEGWLPREKWGAEVNILWVGLGQEVQQQKPKILKKAISCSRPAEAIRLISKLGLDCQKVAAKLGIKKELKEATDSNVSCNMQPKKLLL